MLVAAVPVAAAMDLAILLPALPAHAVPEGVEVGVVADVDGKQPIKSKGELS